MRRDWPFLTLACPAGAEDAGETWLAELLADAALAGDYLGLRREVGGPEVAHLRLTFATAAARDAAAGSVRSARHAASDDTPAISIVEAGVEPDGDWVVRVERAVLAVALGRGLAALPGDAEPLPGRRGLRIARARAFGTGEHASTRLAAAWLEDVTRPGRPMLDLGCGTGLLAAVALARGAAFAIALDIDPDAAAEAARTARLNGMSDLLAASSGLEALAPFARFDTIAANIERDALLDLLPALARHAAPGARIVLSGLLIAQADEVEAEALRHGLVPVGRHTEGEWCAPLLAAPRVTVPRALLADAATGPPLLDREESHHLTRVRRVRAGDPIEVVDGRGGCWSAILGPPGEGRQAVELREAHPEAGESALPITLLQALPDQAGRLEMVLRGVTELGVARFVPVIAARCQGADALRRRGVPARWQRILVEALKQCGRSRLPVLEPVTPFAEAIASPCPGLSLLLDPDGLPPAALSRPTAARGVRLLIGPEGGFTTAERTAALAAGFLPVRLGPRTLRLETAALAGVALAQATWGDL